MSKNEIGIRYFDKWYSFASEKELSDARRNIANALNPTTGPTIGVFISAHADDGSDVQLLVSAGADVVLSGEWK